MTEKKLEKRMIVVSLLIVFTVFTFTSIFLMLSKKPTVIFTDIVNFKPPFWSKVYRYTPYDREKLLNDFLHYYQSRKYKVYLFTYGLNNDFAKLFNLKEYMVGFIPVRLYTTGKIKDFSEVLNEPEKFSGDINSINFMVYSIYSFTSNYISVSDRNKIDEIVNFRRKLKGDVAIYEKKRRNTKFLPIFGKLLM